MKALQLKIRWRFFISFSFVTTVLLFLQVDSRAQPFELLITESPPGPQNQDPATWGGVLQFHLVGSGENLIGESGISKTNLVDPAGLAFRAVSGEIFVGNRHGNNNPSSISRFHYDPITHVLSTNGTITGNGLYGVHQITFNPVTGEMFAANVNNGVSRFTFSNTGEAVPNGTISSGLARGVAVSPDGKRLYVTAASSSIRQFELETGAEIQPVSVPPQNGGGLHYFAYREGELYVAALYDNCVYRFTVGTNNNLTLKDSTTMAAPLSITFSPDEAEMFVMGHRSSDLIYRFRYDPQHDKWTETGAIDTGFSLGAVLMITAPGLAISRTGTDLTVSWPLPANGWVLQAGPALSNNPLDWQDILPPYQTTSTQAWIHLSSPLDTRMFRLKKAQ